MATVENPRKLKNIYVLARHGTSGANEQGIIISTMANGILIEYGLTETGRRQVHESAKKAMEDQIISKDSIIIASPFSRTKQTAQIIVEELGKPEEDIIFDERLVERNFGIFEGKSADHYPNTWENDAKDPFKTENGEESVSEVLNRTVELIRELENIYAGYVIVLVAHGDTLEILEAWMKGLEGESLTRRRSTDSDISFIQMKQAEIRPIKTR